MVTLARMDSYDLITMAAPLPLPLPVPPDPLLFVALALLCVVWTGWMVSPAAGGPGDAVGLGLGGSAVPTVVPVQPSSKVMRTAGCDPQIAAPPAPAPAPAPASAPHTACCARSICVCSGGRQARERARGRVTGEGRE
jgi:hypothetical protein